MWPNSSSNIKCLLWFSALDNDYVKLFFDYEKKDSEWNNLYWKITNDLIEEKLFSFDETLYGDVDFEENEEERDKLIEEEGVYFRIHDCVTKKKEYTIAELLSYNKVINRRKFFIRFGKLNSKNIQNKWQTILGCKAPD